MCDTWVALADTTFTGQVILGKNSDRPVFDCQPLLRHRAQQWSAGSRLQLAYVELPQAVETYATLGSSPYWCWGYEEGINEHGLVIGNEAIFTRTFREAAAAHQAGVGPELGLQGMEIVRLALERSRTAAQAVAVMGELITAYGQFGSAVPGQDHVAGGYDNSFLITDPAEAWILEAVGQRWAARRLTRGVSSISNQPTIRDHWDAGSTDLETYARHQGWWPVDQSDPFDFAWAYVDEQVPRQVSQLRLARSRQLLAEQTGRISPAWMMRIARDHYEDTFLGGPYFDAADPDFQSICMHASTANFTWGNTASSCIAVLPGSNDKFPVFWWTPGPPCNGCYVPFFVHGSRLPEVVTKAGTSGKTVVPPAQAAVDTFSPASYWWRFKCLMDQVKGGDGRSRPGHYLRKNRLVRAQFDRLEAAFAAELPDVLSEAVDQSGRPAGHILADFTGRCVDRVVAVLDELLVKTA
jgi:secernin